MYLGWNFNIYKWMFFRENFKCSLTLCNTFIKYIIFYKRYLYLDIYFLPEREYIDKYSTNHMMWKNG